MPLKPRAMALSTLLLAAAMRAFAQDGPPPAKPYVLHVYANLVQVPTLALTQEFKPLPPLSRDAFSIRLDSGPAFHPTRMHMEGDEPLSLAIVMDASGDQDRLLDVMAQSLSEMAATSLRPHDRVTIFSTDCRLVRSGLNLPPDPLGLRRAVENGLNAPTLHNDQPHHNCGRTRRTWDAASRAVEILAEFPGRRVLLLVSSGNDKKSVYNTR